MRHTKQHGLKHHNSSCCTLDAADTLLHASTLHEQHLPTRVSVSMTCWPRAVPKEGAQIPHGDVALRYLLSFKHKQPAGLNSQQHRQASCFPLRLQLFRLDLLCFTSAFMGCSSLRLRCTATASYSYHQNCVSVVGSWPYCICVCLCVSSKCHQRSLSLDPRCACMRSSDECLVSFIAALCYGCAEYAGTGLGTQVQSTDSHAAVPEWPRLHGYCM